MKYNTSPFKWRPYALHIILFCVRWYCRRAYIDREVFSALS